MDLFSCRICLISDNSKLQSLFLLKNNKTYARMVNFIAGLEILQNDGLPQQICDDCIDQIEISCKIKQKCIDSDFVLHQNVKHCGIKQEKLTVPLIIFTENLNVIDTKNENNDLRSFDSVYEECDDIIHSGEEMKAQLPTKKIEKFTRKLDVWNYKCFICERNFKTVKIKYDHIKNQHSNAKKCTICNKKMKTSITLNDHLMNHSHGHSSICHFCGKGFKIKSKLITHIKTRHILSNKSYLTCDLCGVSTRFKTNIARHMKTVHMKLKKYKCIQCKSEYTTQVGLNFHLYSFHDVEAPIRCPDCNMGFTFNAELRGHIKNRKCTGLPSKRSKNRTEKYYKQSKDGLACSYCTKISSNKQKATMHFCHYHKNSNECKKCDKSFGNSSNLRRHMRQIHEDNFKPFRCDTCEKTFLQKHTLEAHRNTHTGAKPYACDLCLFKAGDRSTISKHKKNFHTKVK